MFSGATIHGIPAAWSAQNPSGSVKDLLISFNGLSGAMVTPVLLQPAVSLRVIQKQKRQLAQQTDGYVMGQT